MQLSFFANGGRLHGHFLQLSRDLVKAIEFLHSNNIAHLDIKPRDVRLQVTDFDLAVRVQRKDEEIDYYRGSKGWMAPEIGGEGGPRQMYSPIKADLWSLGCVLFAFAKRHGKLDDGLEAFAKQLMHRDSYRRPSLLAWL